MLFDLEVLKDGEPKLIRFDNTRNVFSDPETGEEYLRDYRVKDYLRLTDTYDIDFKGIGVLFISLGLNCNYSCKYCHQNAFRKTSPIETSSPEKALRLVDMLRKAGVEAPAISFWGGEPLVHWKSMKAMIPALRELYPDARINFPTNGSLLRKEILDFLKKYDIGFYISYDGKTTNRDASVFDDPQVVEALKDYGKGIDIMPTQNRLSVPVRVLRKELDDLGLPVRGIAAYSIARCNPWNRQFADEIRIPKEQGERYSEFVYRAIREELPEPKLYRGLRDRFEHIASIFYRGLGVDSAETQYCANCTGRDICVDVTGRIFNCMNIPLHVMGTLEDFKPFKATHIYQTHLHKEVCLACPFVTCCRSGCPLIHDDQSMEFKVNCNNFQTIAVPFFRCVVECLLGVYLKKITRLSDGKVFGEF